MAQAEKVLPTGVLTVGSMFAGVGGICLAFRKAGFRVAWANEWDRQACRTYRANFPDHRLIEGDINAVCPTDVGPVDVLTSGFPCQSFSIAIAGHRLGFKDENRGKLFFVTTRFIAGIRPRAYLLENVTGLVNHNKGNTIRVMEETIRELGYSFIPFVLDARKHGNIPQSRLRVFIVGFRDEAYGGPLTDQFSIPDPIPLTLTVGDCLSRAPVADKYYLPDGSYMHPHFAKMALSRNTLYQWRRSYVRESKSSACPTLTANMGSGGHNVPFLLDDRGIRKLTPGECFRFQGFPDDFVFASGMADCHLYKQAGNSVVVPVVKRIAEEIARVLTGGTTRP